MKSTLNQKFYYQKFESSLPSFEVELWQMGMRQFVVFEIFRVDEKQILFGGSGLSTVKVAIPNDQLAFAAAHNNLLINDLTKLLFSCREGGTFDNS